MASDNDTIFNVITSVSSAPKTFHTTVTITNYSDPQKSLVSDQFEKFSKLLWLRRAEMQTAKKDDHYGLSIFD